MFTIALGEYRCIVHMYNTRRNRSLKKIILIRCVSLREGQQKKAVKHCEGLQTGWEKSVTDARWSVERNAVRQGHWWWYNKKRDRKFFLAAFLSSLFFYSKDSVGVENALRSIRSRHWPILTILPSYHVYFRYIFIPQWIINQLFILFYWKFCMNGLQRQTIDRKINIKKEFIFCIRLSRPWK